MAMVCLQRVGQTVTVNSLLAASSSCMNSRLRLNKAQGVYHFTFIIQLDYNFNLFNLVGKSRMHGVGNEKVLIEEPGLNGSWLVE